MDGSRIFFQAVAGHDCTESKHLYIRVDGVETVDLGVAQFLAANETGSEVLLERSKNGTHEVLLYSTSSATETLLFTMPSSFGGDEGHVAGSAKLTALYFVSSEQLTSEASPVSGEERDLYRYDIETRAPLRFIIQATATSVAAASPDGRYVYFVAATVAGIPPRSQVYRYDSTENVVQCVSCSSFDPEPKNGSFLDGVEGLPLVNGGEPSYSAVSSNGEYVFFTTVAALLPADVDLEIPAEGNHGYIENPELSGEYVNAGGQISPSTDVYEWREDGVNGCAQLQGCLALITDGRGGYLNLLLGTANDGNDVFIYTRSKLSPLDVGTEGDIYDVRVDGGFQGPPPRPTECEGDACSTPLSPPNDATPSSLTFSGPGNLAPEATAKAKVKAKKPKKKTKPKSKAKTRHKNKKIGKKTAKKTSKRSAGKMGSTGKNDVRGGK